MFGYDTFGVEYKLNYFRTRMKHFVLYCNIDEMHSSKVQPETLVLPVPCSESSGSSNESTVKDENWSSETQVDRSLSLENMSMSDDKNDNPQFSHNGNGANLMDGNGLGLVDGFGQGCDDGNWSSAVPVNIVDMPSDIENDWRDCEDSHNDNDGNLGQNVSYNSLFLDELEFVFCML